MAEESSKVVPSRAWLSRIETRYEYLSKHWLKEANKVVRLYEAEKAEETPFNILFSNTQTILPTLYSSTPRVEVFRRHTQDDAQQENIDAAVSLTVERFCDYAADTNQGEYETYSDATEAAVETGLVAGLGNVRVRYKAQENYQEICFESVQHDRFVWEAGRKWQHVSWVAFGHDLPQRDFEKTYHEFTKSGEYAKFNWEKLEKEGESSNNEKPQAEDKAVLVWEVWDSRTKKILHICSQWNEHTLLEEDYPEGLTSPFPCPEPLMFSHKLRKFMPVPLYRMYAEQAEQLNYITRRMMRIVRALRVRGIYSSPNKELQTLFEDDTSDNVLVPSESSAAFQDGIDKAIWFMPIDMLVEALNNLYVAQQNILQTIYQILGISDIQRGASDPDETAKAQQIKNNWGGLRVKTAQKKVQEFCRDLFRIATELAATYFTPATWQSITKMPMLPADRKADVQKAMAMYQQQAAAAQQQGQAPPPAPFPAHVAAQAQEPSWEEVIAVLQDNFERSYRIDVETNSTVDLEATEDKQAVAEFMNAFGQMMAGFKPLVEAGIIQYDTVKAFMLEVTKRFRFGRQVEAHLKRMTPPQGGGDQAGAMAAQKERHQAELQKVMAQSADKEAQSAKHMAQQQGEIERLRIENTTLKAEKGLVEREASASQREQAVVHKSDLFSVKSDYQGKVLQFREKGADKEGQLRSRELSVQEKEAEMGLEERAAALMEQIAEAEKRLQGLAEQAGVAGPSDTEKLIAQLRQQQETLLGGMEKVLRAALAPRVSELVVGEDGKKRAVSRVVQQ